MIAEDLKAAVLRWLRFDRQMYYIASEAGEHSSDCLGATRERVIEVETKISVSDLRNDFKKPKHDLFVAVHKKERALREFQMVPNYFYFAVPESLCDEAKRLIAKEGVPYGVLIIKAGTTFADKAFWPSFHVTCDKPARRIHTGHPSPETLRGILMRMGSELVCQTQLAATGRVLKFGLDNAVRQILKAESERKK